MKKYHYLYKITCTVSSMIYIGIHSTDNLDDGYLGSGTVIRNKIAKHGRAAMRKEILEFYPDRETALVMESVFVDDVLLNDPNVMNIRVGGKGCTVAHYKKLSDESKQRRSAALKARWGDDEYRTSMTKLAKSLWDTPTDAMISRLEKMRQARLGSKHTDATRKIISEKNHSNVIWILKWNGVFHYVTDNVSSYIDNTFPFRYGTAFKTIQNHPGYRDKTAVVYGRKETGPTAGFEVCRFSDSLLSLTPDDIIRVLVDANCLFGNEQEIAQLKDLM